MIDINGIAHIQLSVHDLSRSRAFYHRLLHQTFGMTIQYDDSSTFYCIGGRTGVLIRQVADEHRGTEFDQWRVGLHHFCFRFRSAEDIDELHAVLIDIKANIIRAPEKGPWAPGYYSILFEDPDGIRLEAVFIPGAGNLDVIKDKPLTPPGRSEPEA
jgi:catechol 2,3-dioxygenase-like lactoylglutathione lyase family enzyme